MRTVVERSRKSVVTKTVKTAKLISHAARIITTPNRRGEQRETQAGEPASHATALHPKYSH